MIEKETKTKAYSKEGLGLWRRDPDQQKREEFRIWVNVNII